jgi:hypothetical protein
MLGGAANDSSFDSIRLFVHWIVVHDGDPHRRLVYGKRVASGLGSGMAQPLSEAFNKFVLEQAAKVVYSVIEGYEYDNFTHMKNDFTLYKYIIVNSQHSENSIFADESINCAFRAWHDSCHLRANANFSPEGEQRAAMLMNYDVLNGDVDEDNVNLFLNLIHIEVIGQGKYFELYGDFPTHQMDFARGYMMGRGWAV